jgi:hypothetical protein
VAVETAGRLAVFAGETRRDCADVRRHETRTKRGKNFFITN